VCVWGLLVRTTVHCTFEARAEEDGYAPVRQLRPQPLTHPHLRLFPPTDDELAEHTKGRTELVSSSFGYGSGERARSPCVFEDGNERKKKEGDTGSSSPT
jgi:hypothetical protein